MSQAEEAKQRPPGLPPEKLRQLIAGLIEHGDTVKLLHDLTLGPPSAKRQYQRSQRNVRWVDEEWIRRDLESRGYIVGMTPTRRPKARPPRREQPKGH